MRLLHAKTGQLDEFEENNLPPYAILSHTWDGEEVSFQDMQGPDAARKEGYAKIKYASEQAIKDELEYIWMDTCCIDKRSSSELSEAINSMFRWYRNAQICYVYLFDVLPNQSLVAKDSLFRKSRWFTRGWTLQELIAPTNVLFYTRDWNFLGRKGRLCNVIAEITGIDVTYLCDGDLRAASIGKRMSWASNRTTTRKEDMAYCLLGIFGVNMPMLYGEGGRAFIRLQEEIIKESDDQSLFAWSSIESSSSGILAQSPADFSAAGNIVPCRTWNAAIPHYMTSKGLRIELPLYSDSSGSERMALLSCQMENNFFNILAIPLRKIPGGGKDEFERIRRHEPPTPVLEGKWRSLPLQAMYIKKNATVVDIAEYRRTDGILIRRLPKREYGYRLTEVFPPDRWNAGRKIISTYTAYRGWLPIRVLMLFKSASKDDLIVILEYEPPADSPSQSMFRRKRSSVYGYISQKPDGQSLEQLHRERHIGTLEKSQNIDRWRRASVSVNKEVMLGVQMFVLDVDIDADALLPQFH